MSKITNPQSINEWVSELHRVGGLTGETALRAHEKTLERFEAWLAAHPEIERPLITR